MSGKNKKYAASFIGTICVFALALIVPQYAFAAVANPVVSVTSMSTTDYDDTAGEYQESTTHTVHLPSTVVPGNLMIAVLTLDGTPTITPPSGWNQLWQQSASSSLTATAYYRISGSKSDSQSLIQFQTDVAERGSAQVYKVANWYGTVADIAVSSPVVMLDASPAGTTADSPSLTAPWGSQETLWIATAQTSTSRSATSGPTGYSKVYNATSGSNTSSSQIWGAYKIATTATENPDVFQFSSGGVNSVSQTIAVNISARSDSNKVLQHYEMTQDNNTLFVPAYTNKLLHQSDASVRRVVFLSHGSSANIEDYYDYIYQAIGNEPDVLIVAPQLSEDQHIPADDQLFWSSAWRQCNKSSSTLPWRISSCEVYDRMRASIVSTFPNVESFVYIGNSAGAQIVNRYAAARGTTSNIETRFVQMAPSSYLYMDNRRVDDTGAIVVPQNACAEYNEYKYGFDDLSKTGYMNDIGAATLRQQYGDNRVMTLVGSLDNDPNSPSLDTTCEAMAQGAQRLERANRLYQYVGDVYGQTSYTRHKLEVVNGVDHDASEMLNSWQGVASMLQGHTLALPEITQTSLATSRELQDADTIFASDSIVLSVSSRFRNTPTGKATMYIELRNGSIFTAPFAPSRIACDAATSWGNCESKVWKIAATVHSDGTISAALPLSHLPVMQTPYEWQAVVCDERDVCSDWSGYNGMYRSFYVKNTYPDLASTGKDIRSLAYGAGVLLLGAGGIVGILRY